MEFCRAHSLLDSFLRPIERVLAIETHANLEGFAALSGRKGTRSPRSRSLPPSSFSLASSVSSFVTRRSRCAYRVSRLRLSSTSHYVRAKKISREFHTSPSFRVFFPLHRLFPPSYFTSLLLGNREYFEITVCIKSPRTFNMANRVANGSCPQT